MAPSPADSVLRLLACTRLYAAVSRLQAVGAAGRVCPDRRAHDSRVSGLLRVLRERLSRPGLSPVDKARLATAYYDLRFEAVPFSAPGPDEPFLEAVSSLMDRYPSAEEDGAPAEAAVCRCLACYFYPDLWEDDEWACLLTDTVRRWASCLRPDGTWEGLTAAASSLSVHRWRKAANCAASPSARTSSCRAMPVRAMPPGPGVWPPASASCPAFPPPTAMKLSTPRPAWPSTSARNLCGPPRRTIRPCPRLRSCRTRNRRAQEDDCVF